MMRINLDNEQISDLIKMYDGSFYPLKKFMNKSDLDSVIRNYKLENGDFFPIPKLLIIKNESIPFELIKVVELFYNNKLITVIRSPKFFKWKSKVFFKRIFKTFDKKHPGVAKALKKPDFALSGNFSYHPNIKKFIDSKEMNPKQIRLYFKKKKWKTVVGFQTRNIPHLAHEYLLRLSLDYFDGLLINPLIGERKKGDFSKLSIKKTYNLLINKFLNKENVLFNFLNTDMIYAGPREALFHALLRKNFGCTHFIVGRDHAGVGTYYGNNDAQKLTKRFEKIIGIKILNFPEPFYSNDCKMMVTEKSGNMNSNCIRISGTKVRNLIKNGKTDSRLSEKKL